MRAVPICIVQNLLLLVVEIAFGADDDQAIGLLEVRQMHPQIGIFPQEVPPIVSSLLLGMRYVR